MKNMTNMKTLLRLLGATVLTTVAATSVVACGDDSKNVAMVPQVAKDFGFLNSTHDKSLVVAEIKINENVATWNSDQLTNITASKLLDGNNTTDKAKSAESAEFLADVLKLKVSSGEGKDRVFTKADAITIVMTVKTLKPTIVVSSTTDYVVNGGKAVVQFKDKQNIQLGEDYQLDILSNPQALLITSLLPATADISLADFNDITGFAVGSSKTGIVTGNDLFSFFKSDTNLSKQLASIVKLLDKGVMAMKVTAVTASAENFAAGDTIKFKISIGTIVFTEYTLTLV